MHFFFSLYDSLLISLGVMLLVCALGVPALSFLNAAAGTLRRKLFMVKLAGQLSRLGLMFILALTLISAGILAAAFFLEPGPGIWMEHQVFWKTAVYISGAALFFYGLYFLTWNRLARWPVLHLIPAAAAIACCKLLLGLLFLSLWRELEPMSPVHPDPDSIFWPILVQLFLLAIAAGAVLGMLYLLYRRNLDDFGRDYYRYALGLLAKWGIFFAVLSPLTCVWVYFVSRETFDPTYLILPGAGFALFLLFLILILLRIARSQQPMRHKPAVLLCPVLIWLVFTLRLVTYLEMADMVTEEEVLRTFMRDWAEYLGLTDILGLS